MSKEMYNLQIPIEKELAEKLKQLAKEDERSLRVYCRNILKQYLNGNMTIEEVPQPKDELQQHGNEEEVPQRSIDTGYSINFD